MQLEVKKEIIDWCNQQVDEGKELKFTWEGGGDSGWAEFKVDDEDFSNEFSDDLLNGIYEELDYGSWAGEFHSSGEAIYNKEEQAFVGIDDYSEDETIGHTCEIVVDVPSTLWYDSINIRLECDHEDAELQVTVDFVIKHGFISEEHNHVRTQIEDYLRDKVIDEIENFANSNEFRSMWDTITLNRSEGVETTPGFVKYEITSLSMGTTHSQEKSIYLQLIEQENEQE